MFDHFVKLALKGLTEPTGNCLPLFLDVPTANSRDNRTQVFLKISQISHENTCIGISFKVKERLQYICFPVKFAKFLGIPFFYRTPPVSATALEMRMDNFF